MTALRTPTVVALALLTAIAPLATDMYLPALPTMVGDLGSTASGVQLTLTTFLVGLALGQLVIGPLSDQFGRRRLLLAGTVVCALAGAVCAIAPNEAVLVAARFVQGFSGAAGIVLSRAVIADRAAGERAARLFSLMMVISGVAPVVAPLLGGSLLGAVGWRGIFWILAAIAVVMVLAVVAVVPESLPIERRRPGGLAATWRAAREVLGDRVYLGYTLTFAFAFTSMFAYISASSFVYQNVLGLSTVQYSIAFAANAFGLVAASAASGALTGRLAPLTMLRGGVAVLVVDCAALLAVVLAGAPRWGVLVLLFLAVSSLGFVLGNATSLATGRVPRNAGTGSAVLGALQFGLGALASPVVGLAGESDARPMAVTMVVVAVLSLLSLWTLARERVDASGAPGAAVERGMIGG
ncbi:multidrug effflux MFS transporter [Kineococcus sp. SYSU DK003]|uniref:multidrug effflux MFS transporter n=1 Tax=Kineococcus sp. SYSU DK003 TaxID=3383124 RepID=UPI003D7C8F52